MMVVDWVATRNDCCEVTTTVSGVLKLITVLVTTSVTLGAKLPFVYIISEVVSVLMVVVSGINVVEV